ncbi:MAG: STAS domain-containing protein [Actinomycetota bacterium]|nr:STAS domain-containing protein [Actinomycetota bacterium]
MSSHCLGCFLPDEPSPETPERPVPLRRSLVVSLDHRNQGVVIVRVGGEIDSATAPRLSATLHRELDSGTCRVVVLDLRTVDFLGAQGIVVLGNARQHAKAYHIDFCLIAGGAVRRLLQALGVIEDFQFCDNDYE